MLTDTHCHLYLNKFDNDRAEVIQNAVAAGIERMLVPGLDIETSKAAIQLAEAYANVYAAVGFHPTDIEKLTPESFAELQKLVQHPKVVAIGEIGLDYYWVKDPAKRLEQREKLPQQLALAQAVNKPIILHLREENDTENAEGTKNLLDILRTWQKELLASNHPLATHPGVFHSFNGDLASAQQAIELNYNIGITGPVTYKNAEGQRQLVKQLPLAALLIETDAPFLTPVPHRGKRNEPKFVAHVADKIAEVHNTSRDHVAQVTSANANRLFGWEATP